MKLKGFKWNVGIVGFALQRTKGAVLLDCLGGRENRDESRGRVELRGQRYNNGRCRLWCFRQRRRPLPPLKRACPVQTQSVKLHRMAMAKIL